MYMVKSTVTNYSKCVCNESTVYSNSDQASKQLKIYNSDYIVSDSFSKYNIKVTYRNVNVANTYTLYIRNDDYYLKWY